MKDDHKLLITIKHTQPVDLINLTVGLSSLVTIYQYINNNDWNIKLFVKDIRKSSIQLDLITNFIASAVPILNESNNLIQFSKFLTSLILSCSNKAIEAKRIIEENALPVPSEKNFKAIGNVASTLTNKEDRSY